MKKKKISEFPVNAATLNNQPDTYYNFRSFGLGIDSNDNTPIIADCNNDRKTGFYSASIASLNIPTADAYTLLYIKRGPGYIFQIAVGSSTSNNNIYVRNQSNSVWSSWRKVTVVSI